MDKPKSNRIYDHPAYYEAAFSFRDISREVDVFQRCIDRFSGIIVRRVLELGCGPAPHMKELIGKGYEYVGIDTSEKMLDYAKSKADKTGLAPTLLMGDMMSFRLKERVDFAFVLLGSLCAANTVELLQHFEAVARALNPGGVYLLDWCVQFDGPTESSESWAIEKGELRIETSCSMRLVDPVGQTFEEVIKMKVSDQGSHYELEERSAKRAIYPQEFKLLIEKTGCFEFVGWWNNWNLDEPLEEGATRKKDDRIQRPIILIRRV